MLACIPTKGKNGIEDKVSDHFGSAPYFTLFDTDSEGRIRLEGKPSRRHLVKDDAQRINIRSLVDIFTLDLLGTHVFRSAYHNS